MFPIRCIQPPCMNMAVIMSAYWKRSGTIAYCAMKWFSSIRIERDLVQKHQDVDDDDPDRDERRRCNSAACPEAESWPRPVERNG